MSLIELGQPADRPGDPSRQRPSRRIIVVAVVALLAGAVLGSLITHRWTVQQRRSADERKVSVLVFAAQPPGGTAVSSVVIGDGIVRVTLNAAITVVNAGPQPVEVQILSAENTGLTLVEASRPEWIPAGTSLPAYVNLEATCVVRPSDGATGVNIGGGPVRTTASVRTIGGSVTTLSSLSFETAPWTTQYQTAVDKCLAALK